MNRNIKVFLFLVVLGVTGSFLIWGIRSWGKSKPDQDDKSPAIGAASQSNPIQQANAVHLDENALRASGIKTITLTESSGRDEREASAVILSPQELLDLRNSYVANEFQIEKAQASLRASSMEYKRLAQLNREDKNASDKAVEMAETVFQSDQATLHNAEQIQSLAVMSAQQRWGPVVGGWIEHDTAALRGVLAGRQALVQVSLPAGASAPSRLAVRMNSKTIPASLVSALPRIDPRFQTPSFLYLAEAAATQLVPGMNVSVFVASGPIQRGVRVPADAILWWQGKSWVYVEAESGVFLRKEIPQRDISSNGWFVPEELHPGDHVVVVGAQQLLSQEFHSQTSAAAGDED